MDESDHDYYLGIAQDADAWAQGLTMIDGGKNLLRIASDFENKARRPSALTNERTAYTTLAAALRRHVRESEEFDKRHKR